MVFSKMLAIEPNHVSNEALEVALLIEKNSINENNLYSDLEKYLQQQNWRKADEETTWIFYQVIGLEGLLLWYNLLEHFPHDILNKIDQLWVRYSNGHFGFSIQKQIWERLGGKLDRFCLETKYEIKRKFGKEVGWWEDESNYRKYESLKFTIAESPKGNLPAHWITRPGSVKGELFVGCGCGPESCLMLLFPNLKKIRVRSQFCRVG
jgi:hypothetical protein